jgi:hypothetical protein
MIDTISISVFSILALLVAHFSIVISREDKDE